jgi:hypothetical protein
MGLRVSLKKIDCLIQTGSWCRDDDNYYVDCYQYKIECDCFDGILDNYLSESFDYRLPPASGTVM